MASPSKRSDKIRRFAGILLLLSGLALCGLCLYPRIWLALHPPGRYHYYYISDESKLVMIGYLGGGVTLIALGVWLLIRSRK